MDIFKQNRNLLITIIILVLMNIFTITLLWLGKPKFEMREPPIGAEQKPEQITNLLMKELGFSEMQAENYILMRKEHRKKTKKIEDGLRKLKKEMFDKAILSVDETTISDSLLNLVQEQQGQIERLTFQHFMDLKNMCSSEQKKKLRHLMHKLFGPPPGGRMEGPPPGGERPPINN